MVFTSVRDHQARIIDFQWKFINPEARSLVGMKPIDLLDKKLLEEMPENRDFGLFDKYVEVVESGKSCVFDIEYTTEEISKWFHVQAVKLDDGFVVTFLDISRMKHYESELLRKEKLLSEAQDLANLGSWSWDLRDSKVVWSSKVYEIFEIDDSSVPSYSLFINSIVPEDRIEIEATIESAIKKNQPYDLSFRIQPGEYLKYLEARAIPKIGPDNKIQEYLGIIKDITAEKTQQEILRKSRNRKRQVEKVASSERMAKSIAHEIRNPLTNITLATEQLKAEVEEPTQMFLEMISRNSKRIEDLIRKLMDSAQQAALDKRHHNINDILDEAISLSMDRIQLRKIKIIKNYQQDMCGIPVDGEKVRVALLNIIINAIEAIADNGLVKLETKLSEEECIVIITDDGLGIAKDQLHQLFDPFFTGKKKGLGLGLTSTLNILNSHDANIEVDSELGKGTTFTITFKRA
ncbi:MAG: hypothetical protein DHS20C17_24000 [Cyclobacteriaceae bacterium]|nr:MAG: hypothetical protein DHS20C17_24000 [Cyclobacteriaceae bacterium]